MVSISETTGKDAVDVFAEKNRLQGIGLVRDPLPKMHELRQQCPVHQGSISGKYGIQGPDNALYTEDEQVSVFGFEAVEEGFRDASRFSSSMYQRPLGRIIGKT